MCEGLGLTWQEAFRTDDRAAVEEYCARNGQTLEWTDAVLRTRHVGPSFVDEPHTGETVWFNQANLFHVSSLGDEVSEALLPVVNNMLAAHGREPFTGKRRILVAMTG